MLQEESSWNMALPKLPSAAAYIHLRNPGKRNALSLCVLKDLRDQLHRHLTSPATGKVLTLPPFRHSSLKSIQSGEHRWLLDADEWKAKRAGLPKALVLRSEGPVFCSGHDLKELAGQDEAAAKDLFDACADVMSLIRHSPAPVVCPVQGTATAAGFQMAMAADYPIALASTLFCLPGMRIGFPCVSPATFVARRLPPALVYRMFATGDAVPAAELGAAVDVVSIPKHAESTDTAAAAFEARVDAVVQRLAVDTSGQAQAFGKWAFWTQLARADSNDSFVEAARWASGVMALQSGHLEDANEGIAAFVEKRAPSWKT